MENRTESLEILDLLSSVEQEAEQNRKLLDSLTCLTSSVIYRLDPEGKITYINDAIRQFGYEPAELIGKPILDLVHPDFKEAARYKIRERRTGERKTRDLEIRICRRGGGSGSVDEVPLYLRIVAEGLYQDEAPEGSAFLGTQGVGEGVWGEHASEQVEQHRIDELAALGRFGWDVTRALTVSGVVKAAMDGLTMTINPDLAVFYVIDDRKLHLADLRSTRADIDREDWALHQVGECLCGMAAEGRTPLYSLDIRTDPRCTLEECKAAGFKSFASFPLLVEDKLLGVVGLGTVEQEFKRIDRFKEK